MYAGSKLQAQEAEERRWDTSQQEERWADVDTATRSSKSDHIEKGAEKYITAREMVITTAGAPGDEKITTVIDAVKPQ